MITNFLLYSSLFLCWFLKKYTELSSKTYVNLCNWKSGCFNFFNISCVTVTGVQGHMVCSAYHPFVRSAFIIQAGARRGGGGSANEFIIYLPVILHWSHIFVTLKTHKIYVKLEGNFHGKNWLILNRILSNLHATLGQNNTELQLVLT